MSLPILYSFRRCPYAIRARLALQHCGAQCELREVVLKDKPNHLLEVSEKGTVPVLLLPKQISPNPIFPNQILPNQSTDGPESENLKQEGQTTFRVIDESIEIMRWAMLENPHRQIENAEQWLHTEAMSEKEIIAFITQNDTEFKLQLDKYKYSDRHPEHPQSYYLEQAMPFLEKLEGLLATSSHLSSNYFGFMDAALLPFVRQFSMVQPKQFNSLPLPKLQQWLAHGLNSDLFLSVMRKYAPWQANSSEAIVVFGNQ